MDEFTIERIRRLSEQAEERENRALTLAAHRKLYRQANGLDPASAEVLAIWVAMHLKDTPIDPYEILDRAERAQVWEDVEGLSR